jgi:hypothetical protein
VVNWKEVKKVTIIFTIVVESLSSRIISEILNPLIGSIPKVLISKLSEPLKLIVCQVVDKAKLGKTLTSNEDLQLIAKTTKWN